KDISEERRPSLKEFFNAVLSEPEWTHEKLEERARAWVEEHGVKMKDYAMPLRFALTGMKVSPGVFEVAVHLGRDEVKRRLEFYNLI
ncbi:MAG: glutamate--tRNA ligase, partial [Synergistaceae bacterium]|nr:glutamate--tRNA ligase [Synergistaceae bacterium]